MLPPLPASARIQKIRNRKAVDVAGCIVQGAAVIGFDLAGCISWPSMNCSHDILVDWSLIPNVTAQFVTDVPIMVFWHPGKPNILLHHSGQGGQYTSEQFQHLMTDHGITCSMSCSGNI